MYVPLFPSSLRTQQLKQVQLVTLLKPLHNNAIVRHCYVVLVTQQLKQRRFYAGETSNEHN
jgi:hypothetical protein